MVKLKKQAGKHGGGAQKKVVRLFPHCEYNLEDKKFCKHLWTHAGSQHKEKQKKRWTCTKCRHFLARFWKPAGSCPAKCPWTVPLLHALRARLWDFLYRGGFERYELLWENFWSKFCSGFSPPFQRSVLDFSWQILAKSNFLQWTPFFGALRRF